MKEAKELIDKINEIGGLSSYRYSNNKNYVWNIAIALYARHNPNANARKGCSSCAKSAYGWLTKEAEKASKAPEKVEKATEEISNELKAAYKEKTGVKRIKSSVTKAEMLEAIKD